VLYLRTPWDATSPHQTVEVERDILRTVLTLAEAHSSTLEELTVKCMGERKGEGEKEGKGRVESEVKIRMLLMLCSRCG
jgi:hypothetical protein